MQPVDELGARIRDMQQSWDIRAGGRSGAPLKDGARWLLAKGLGPPLDRQADFNWAIVSGLQLAETALARLSDGKADREQTDELRGGLEGVRREFESLRADFQAWSDRSGQRLADMEAILRDGLSGQEANLERLGSELAEVRARQDEFAGRIDFCLTVLARCERLVKQAVQAAAATNRVPQAEARQGSAETLPQFAEPGPDDTRVEAPLAEALQGIAPEEGDSRGEAPQAISCQAGAGLPPGAGSSTRQGREVGPTAPGRYGGIDYFKFEARFRGSRESIRRRHEVYVPLMLASGPVVDIGCGRGEFLEALRDAGLKGMGVELDPDMTAFCQSLDLDVRLGSGEAFLAAMADASLGGVFLGQVVEHMTPAALAELLAMSIQRLQPGAAFVAETPNPVCPTALANFFIDPTHVRPVHPELFGFLAEAAGFTDIEFLFTSPLGDLPPVLRSDRAQPEGADRYMDYALVARRPPEVPHA